MSSELSIVISKLRALGAKAYLTIKHTPYTIVLDGFIGVEDGSGSRVNWASAFGSRPPTEVLNMATRVEVQLKDKVITMSSVKELINWAKSKA